MSTVSAVSYLESDGSARISRRAKGKQKETHQQNRCTSGSGRPSRVLTAEDTLRSHIALPRRRSASRSRSTPVAGIFPWMHQAKGHPSPSLCRRYISTAPVLARHASTSYTTPPIPEPLEAFRELLDLPDDQFNAEAAWEMYVAAQRHDRSQTLEPEETLRFADRLVTRLEGDRASDAIQHWKERLQTLLEDVAPRIQPDVAFRQHSISARAYAVTGDIEAAGASARNLTPFADDEEQHFALLRAFESIMHASLHWTDPREALTVLMNHWEWVHPHLAASRNHSFSPAVLGFGRSFRDVVYDTIEEVDEPARVLSDAMDTWDKELRQRAAELMLRAYYDRGFGQDALAVMREMKRQGLPVHPQLELYVVRALVKADLFQDASDQFAELSNNSPEQRRHRFYHSTGLLLSAHQGDLNSARDFYDELSTSFGGAYSSDKALLLHAYAVRGDTEGVCELFGECFPDASRGVRPDIYHYTAVIFAHAQRSDFDGMNTWLERMSTAGVEPDIHVYSIILKGLALRGDVDSVAAVLDQMRATGIPPTAVAYTTVIKVLASRRDPVAAEAIYKRAIEEGVTPDRKMMTVLMDAHVEAGSWQGVIRIFDYLKQSYSRRLRLSIQVYNTLLKAYVLIGAPYRIISGIVGRLEDIGVQPDAHTFALLVQSACDNNQMDIATSIFLEMERLAKKSSSDKLINVYVMTIIMAAYLRLGKKQMAKAVYDDMRARGIRPTSITFGHILGAYGNEGTDESLKIAEEYLQELTAKGKDDRWMQAEEGRAAALRHVYSPLMATYTRRNSPEDVERLFQRMLDAGGETTLGTLAMLMDAHRRAHNFAAVKRIWPQIFRLAMRYSRVDALFPQEDDPQKDPRRQTNVLCVPLSIYIDACSVAGAHLEIAAVWRTLQTSGFMFDSHNWNHLCVALVRAGEPERAFEVVERILLPFQEQSRRLVMERDKTPQTPLSFEEPVDEQYAPDPPLESPLRRAKARRAAIRKNRRKGATLERTEGEDVDFAHPLHVLQQISLTWNSWRPHMATLNVLDMVLERLESGRLIQPLKPPERDGQEEGDDLSNEVAGAGEEAEGHPEDKEWTEPSEEEQRTETSEEKAPESEEDQARATLARLYRDYPHTLATVEAYVEAEERRRSRF